VMIVYMNWQKHIEEVKCIISKITHCGNASIELSCSCQAVILGK